MFCEMQSIGYFVHTDLYSQGVGYKEAAKT